MKSNTAAVDNTKHVIHRPAENSKKAYVDNAFDRFTTHINNTTDKILMRYESWHGDTFLSKPLNKIVDYMLTAERLTAGLNIPASEKANLQLLIDNNRLDDAINTYKNNKEQSKYTDINSLP